MKRIAEKRQPTSRAVLLIRQAAGMLEQSEHALKEWTRQYVRNHSQRLAFDLDLVAEKFPVPSGIKILEIGSAPYVLSLALKKAGYVVTCTDIEPSRFETFIRQEDLSVTRADLDDPKQLPFEDGSFDLVLCHEVLEHLRGNLIFSMEECRRVLAPNGFFFLSTPNLQSIQGIFHFLFCGQAISAGGSLYEEWSKLKTHGHMGHVREYTVREISELLKQCHLNPEELIYRGTYGKKYFYLDQLCPRFRPFFSLISKAERKD